MFILKFFGSLFPELFLIESPGWTPAGIFTWVNPLPDLIVVMHPNTASKMSIYTYFCTWYADPFFFFLFLLFGLSSSS